MSPTSDRTVPATPIEGLPDQAAQWLVDQNARVSNSAVEPTVRLMALRTFNGLKVATAVLLRPSASDQDDLYRLRAVGIEGRTAREIVLLRDQARLHKAGARAVWQGHASWRRRVRGLDGDLPQSQPNLFD